MRALYIPDGLVRTSPHHDSPTRTLCCGAECYAPIVSRWVFAFLMTTACGGRSELDQTPLPAESCAAGGAPVAIATDLLADAGVSAFDTRAAFFMATEGSRVWVAQVPFVPALWSVAVGGGARRVDLDIIDPQSVGPLSIANGRLFFDVVTLGPHSVLSSLGTVSTSGGPLAMFGLESEIEAFDWDGARAYGLPVNPRGPPISEVSLSDGTTTTFANPAISGYELNWVRVTSKFMHVRWQPAAGNDFIDQRLDIATGALHDEVPFSGDMAGPSDVCGLVEGASADEWVLSCLSDSASQPRTLASNLAFLATPSGEARILDVDATWVYVKVGGSSPHLSRFSLADGHEQVLMNDVTTLAVTGFGSCVFALTWTNRGSTLWRLSP